MNEELKSLDAEIREALLALHTANANYVDLRLGERHFFVYAIDALQRAGALVAAIHGEAQAIEDSIENAQTVYRPTYIDIKARTQKIMDYTGIGEETE